MLPLLPKPSALLGSEQEPCSCWQLLIEVLLIVGCVSYRSLG